MITVMVMGRIRGYWPALYKPGSGFLYRRTLRVPKGRLGGFAMSTVVAMAAVVSIASQPVRAATPRSDVVDVVAAENFWGNIAAQIGGNDVQVTSLITNPNADPHLFETDAADAAKLAQARVIVENGAGYDGWMTSLLNADSGHPTVVNAGVVLHVAGSDPNPHLWYNIPRVPKVAAAISAALSKADPRASVTFKRNLQRFDASLVPLIEVLAKIRTRYADAPVAYTERVPGYALAAAHLTVKTPVGFARAIEDGEDPGPGDTLAMEQLLTKHRIDVLLYNVQTLTPVTAQIRALAKKNGIAVVGVSETMPTSARTYQRWQLSQLNALYQALRGADSKP
jgi:zinc/manganese transport system substrate-binding protein